MKDDELWLKKIKERLDDYSEPLPDTGWERLEKVLPASAPDRKSTRLNSSHIEESRMPSSA